MDSTVVPRELLEAHRRPFTVDEYHRMIDAGVFHEDDHSELLHGVLVARSPQGGPHARVIQRLNGLLVRGLGEAYDVRVQLPLTLRADDSEPEPDFSVVRHGDFGHGNDHPATALLVVEISRSSLRFDRNVKAPLYARAGVRELWIVDVNGRQIEVLREPDPTSATWRVQQIVGLEEELSLAAIPSLRFGVRDLLG
jgi:Uma2 family endonuclease